MTTHTPTRDYALAESVSRLSDDVLVGVKEAAALTGFAAVSLQQRRVRAFPKPLNGVRILRWRLGDLRLWMKTSETASLPPSPPARNNTPKKSGRPRLPVGQL